MAAVSPPLDMLLQLSVCGGARMSLGLGECQWRADPSVTVSRRRVMNGSGIRGEDGGERCERRTNDELTTDPDCGGVVNRSIRG